MVLVPKTAGASFDLISECEFCLMKSKTSGLRMENRLFYRLNQK